MSTNQVNQAVAVEPKARDVYIVHKVNALLMQLVIGVPVAANSQNITA